MDANVRSEQEIRGIVARINRELDSLASESENNHDGDICLDDEIEAGLIIQTEELEDRLALLAWVLGERSHYHV